MSSGTRFNCDLLIHGDLKSLFTHLRAVHNITSASTHFKCCEHGCRRTFYYLRSYKRHLLKHEPCSEKDAPSAPETEQPRTIAEHAVLDPNTDGPNDDWDDLGPEGVMNRVATFLACLRSRLSQTFSSVNYVVQETSSFIHNIVTDLQNKMMIFQRLGQEDFSEVQVLRE